MRPLEAEYGRPGMLSMMMLLVDGIDELRERGSGTWQLAEREDVQAYWGQVPERDRMLLLGIAVAGKATQELPGPAGAGLDLARRLQDVARSVTYRGQVCATVAELPVPATDVALGAVVRLVAAGREKTTVAQVIR